MPQDKIELVEEIDEKGDKYILSPIIDGKNANLFRQKLIEDCDGDESISNNVFTNAIQSLRYFVNPSHKDDSKTLSKILTIGRVQSGKTSFFLATISLAFDNGYNLAYLIGGTKKPLVDQNYDRSVSEFANNYNVKIYLINEVDENQVSLDIDNGFKVIIVALKNSAVDTNLGKVQKFVCAMSNIPTLIVDDEGDEYTPGMEAVAKRIGRDGVNHDLIADIISIPSICTFLSVTATPQANFLISTINAISPDFCVLVQPGAGYTGGNSFHDTEDNPHIQDIYDGDDFSETIPESFKDALYFFIFSICFKRSKKDFRPFSMLIHPSSLKAIHENVAEKIKLRIEAISRPLTNRKNVSHTEHANRVLDQFETYKKMNPEYDMPLDAESIISEFSNALSLLEIFVFNTGEIGRNDILAEKASSALYKIYVGGNMLGRGLTIKNLSLSYIFRDSKVTAIDTLYQRARWMGYKGEYFDVCKVYMTQSLKEKFVAISDNENDMWNSISAFLQTKYRIKDFPRLFTLSDDSGKLILTRKSISKTLTVEIVSGGYQYDKTLAFSPDSVTNNRENLLNYLTAHENGARLVQFGTSDVQRHLVIETSFSEFFNEFISKYQFPNHSKKIGRMSLEKLYDQVQSGIISDELSVLIMRYENKEFRSFVEIDGQKWLKELPQSYNEGVTQYEGDKNLSGYKDKMHIQIHLVYIDKNNTNDYYPILVLNNPLSKKTIRFVTGENDYGQV